MSTPLEQFSIEILGIWIISGLLDISISNSTVYLVISSVCVFVYLYYLVYNVRIVPDIAQYVVESVFCKVNGV